MRAKIFLILSIFLIIVVSGIVFVLGHFDISEIYHQITSLTIVVIVWIAVLLLVYWLVNRYIYIPVKEIEKVLKHIAVGDLSETVKCKGGDELGQIAGHINVIVKNQSDQAEFLEKIGDGNFNIEYVVLSGEDKLGYSIKGMRDKLHKLVTEDARTQWSTEGIARFGATLRDNTDDIKVLFDKFLSDLIKYLSVNQGAIYLLNNGQENGPFLEMVSVYAWGRKKFISKTIEIGEGLIGQTALEKGTTYLTEVPDNYIKITSGLGDSNPKSILIVPLLFNEELFGVMEFASFKQLEPFEIDFVEKLAEIVASTISRININKQTKKLLQDSQKLTEELRTQEEELRQSMEEMNATQEEMQQREVERIGIFTAINNTIATVEFDMSGKIIDANNKFLGMMGYSIEEVENQTDRMFADKSNEPIEMYNEFWRKLAVGELQGGDFKRLTRSGREIWLNASYTPALNKDGIPYKVIALATDITEKKNAELETKRQAEELRLQGEKLQAYTRELEDIKQNLSEKLEEASLGLKKKIIDIETEKAKNIAILEGCVDSVVSFDHTGKIEYFNKTAEETWGIQRSGVIGKNIEEIIPLKLEQMDGSYSAYAEINGSKKELGVRTEVSWSNIDNKDFDMLVTLTRANIQNTETFTIFAQQISVDLF